MCKKMSSIKIYIYIEQWIRNYASRETEWPSNVLQQQENNQSLFGLCSQAAEGHSDLRLADFRDFHEKTPLSPSSRRLGINLATLGSSASNVSICPCLNIGHGRSHGFLAQRLSPPPPPHQTSFMMMMMRKYEK